MKLQLNDSNKLTTVHCRLRPIDELSEEGAVETSELGLRLTELEVKRDTLRGIDCDLTASPIAILLRSRATDYN